MSTATLTRPKQPKAKQDVVGGMIKKAMKNHHVSARKYLSQRLEQIDKAIKGANSPAYLLRLRRIRKTLKKLTS